MARAAVSDPLPLAGPGLIGPGTDVTCDPGGLPAAYPNMTAARIVAVSPIHSRVRVHGETVERRVPNTLIRLDHRDRLARAWPADPRDVALPFGRYTDPRTGAWLPHYAWIGWSVAEHLEYARGERPLVGVASPPPRRLVIVGCARLKREGAWDAVNLYIGSYHLAARRAADALLVAGGHQVILSAAYGLLDLHDPVRKYDVRMGDRDAIGAESVAYQAGQLGLLGADEVIVLAGRAYADVVTAVWPHTRRPLDGTSGIGPQLRRLAAIAETGELPFD